ncbi:MAG: oligoendopeptidase F [Candidatus Wallbacteria bacterium HGW-Wallbacteria-1]|jgi:pepF/M3 family oligoendopeptidase|uniref:Oligoendopeptidase F n=1 Tax=Candidatus Wallbacteria bacterium HGW-Wallbacteria-1 TaxID=2013854 RepID=A0A2N1PNU9_9BACT|nr:MAG: oligoendopeptidase F [Candidatus Wallbacteria bacterium HGW-Wallbacteria-1]
MTPTDWNLDSLYSSLDSDEYKRDFAKCIELRDEFIAWINEVTVGKKPDGTLLSEYYTRREKHDGFFSRIYIYAKLLTFLDARNSNAHGAAERIQLAMLEMTAPMVSFVKWLATAEDIDQLIESTPLTTEHDFHIRRTIREATRLLSQGEEVLIARLSMSGSNAWENLYETLVSTLVIDMVTPDGSPLPEGMPSRMALQSVRNMYSDPDTEKRRIAWHSELLGVKTVEESISACLNSLKAEAITVSEARGYDSILEMTLENANMSRQTFDALMDAIDENLPLLQSYFSLKAKYLGYDNGLPFWEIFAPLGNESRRFTLEQAREIIVETFSGFSRELGEYADMAFEKGWIDSAPRDGKRGGAFCVPIHSIGESRIMCTFSGSLKSLITIAHELGHGYHNHCMRNRTHVNSGAPMPLAETASIFCETVVKSALMKDADPAEAFAIVEADLSDVGQKVTDIMTRYLFEKGVIEERKDSALPVRRLNELMIQSQKAIYGESMDPDQLHPYMWLVKSHYYSSSWNYYNFPYAFGILFAKGLYAEYLRQGDAFISRYVEFLSSTGMMTLEQAASIAGVDVTRKEFWQGSMNLVKEDTELFRKFIETADSIKVADSAE